VGPQLGKERKKCYQHNRETGTSRRRDQRVNPTGAEGDRPNTCGVGGATTTGKLTIGRGRLYKPPGGDGKEQQG